MKISKLSIIHKIKNPESIFTIAKNQKYIITGSVNGEMKIWNLNYTLHKLVKKHTGSISSIRFSRDQKFLASAGDDGYVYIYSSPDFDQIIHTINHNIEVTHVEWGSNFIISTDLGGVIRVTTFESKIIEKKQVITFNPFKIMKTKKPIMGLTISQNSLYFATYSEKVVKLYKNFVYQTKYISEKGIIMELVNTRPTFSPCSNYIGVGLQFNKKAPVVSIFDLELNRVFSLVGHTSPSEVICFNPHHFVSNKKQKGTYSILAIGSQDLSVSFWTTNNPKPFLLVKNFTENPILDMFWDKMTFYASSYDGVVKKIEFTPNEFGKIVPVETVEQNTELPFSKTTLTLFKNAKLRQSSPVSETDEYKIPKLNSYNIRLKDKEMLENPDKNSVVEESVAKSEKKGVVEKEDKNISKLEKKGVDKEDKNVAKSEKKGIDKEDKNISKSEKKEDKTVAKSEKKEDKNVAKQEKKGVDKEDKNVAKPDKKGVDKEDKTLNKQEKKGVAEKEDKNISKQEKKSVEKEDKNVSKPEKRNASEKTGKTREKEDKTVESKSAKTEIKEIKEGNSRVKRMKKESVDNKINVCNEMEKMRENCDVERKKNFMEEMQEIPKSQNGFVPLVSESSNSLVVLFDTAVTEKIRMVKDENVEFHVGNYKIELENREVTVLRDGEMFYSITGNVNKMCSNKKYLIVYTNYVQIYELETGILLYPYIYIKACFMDLLNDRLLILDSYGEVRVLILSERGNIGVDIFARLSKTKGLSKIILNRRYNILAQYDNFEILYYNRKMGLWNSLNPVFNSINSNILGDSDETVEQLELDIVNFHGMNDRKNLEIACSKMIRYICSQNNVKQVYEYKIDKVFKILGKCELSFVLLEEMNQCGFLQRITDYIYRELMK